MHVIESIINRSEKLLSGLNIKHQEKCILALNRLIESLKGLKLRAMELADIEKRIADFDPGKGDNLDDLQLKFVNKVEAYYQQVYAILSNLIMVVNYLGINGKKFNHPIKSVTKFLKFIKNNFHLDNLVHDNYLKTTINILLDSVTFRDKYIDHPQQNKTHYWMTYSFQGKCYAIYFVPDNYNSFIVRTLEEMNPESLSFKPPKDWKNFKLSPWWGYTQQAVVDLISFVLG